MSSQTDLLYWASGRIKHYAHLGPIQEVNRDTFGNGLALCALLHSYHGDAVVPYGRLSPKHRQLNLEIALTEADALGIPHLMDVADFLHTVCPELKSTTLLLSYWHEYLALPPDERKAPSHSDDELRRLLDERPARIADYLRRIDALDSAPNTCQRCGNAVDDADTHFHPDCTRCLRCGTREDLAIIDAFRDWFCPKCTRFQSSLTTAATGRQPSHSDVVRSELRQAELSALKEKRAGASNPFAEAERQREEEKKRRLAAFRDRPSSSSPSAATPPPAAATPVAAPTPAVATPTTTTTATTTASSSDDKPAAASYVFGDRCKVCSKVVYATEKIVADTADARHKDTFHKACFRCVHCRAQLKLGSYASLEGQYYCKPHFKQLFALKGNYSEGFGKDKPQDEWAAKAAQPSSSPVAASPPAATSPAVDSPALSPRAEIETSTPSTPSGGGEIKPSANPGKIVSPFAELERQREEERRRARAGLSAVAAADEPRASPGKIASPFAQMEAEASQRRTAPSAAPAPEPAAPSSSKLGDNNPFKEAERRREAERRAKMEAILGRR